jgi:tripartite-type tricarboxylate transporter receptor subunit TctC
MTPRLLAIAFALLAGITGASGETYPARQVKVIVPFAPGGVTDVIARLWAQAMSESLGQQFYIENHGGGGGNLGMALAARQPADGYTVLVASSSLTINPSLYNKLTYDPVKDFDAVTLLATTPNVLVVHPSVPAKTTQELIALIRANPGKYSYAMSGAGTPNHIQAEMFKTSLKLDFVTVPFNGGGPAIQSTLGGHTPIAFTAFTPVQSLVTSGQLRALGVSGDKRSPLLPNVPTLAEAGVRGQEAGIFSGALVPAGTPRDIIEKLQAETLKVLSTPAMQAQLAKLGLTAGGNTPEEFAAQLKAERESWGRLIAEARIQKQ